MFIYKKQTTITTTSKNKNIMKTKEIDIRFNVAAKKDKQYLDILWVSIHPNDYSDDLNCFAIPIRNYEYSFPEADFSEIGTNEDGYTVKELLDIIKNKLQAQHFNMNDLFVVSKSFKIQFEDYIAAMN